jgi:hypothetical protein
MTEVPVISEPVPAVVGTQTIGTTLGGSGRAESRNAEAGSSADSSAAAS